MEIEEYERIQPVATIPIEGRRLRFFTPNRQTVWRAKTFFTKEPDTLAWIGGFARGDVLLDIGANVGMYSIYAAATRDAMVYAFEPESQNYALLNRNIHDNGLGGRVLAYATALSDATGFHRLYLSEFIAGGSCHNFGEATNYRGEPMATAYEQGCFSTTVDALVAQGAMPVPTHIKIDVDGIEPKVLAGAHGTLRDARLQSVLIEINTNLESHWEMVDAMLDAGFDYDRDQADGARRERGAFKGVGNYVFRR